MSSSTTKSAAASLFRKPCSLFTILGLVVDSSSSRWSFVRLRSEYWTFSFAVVFLSQCSKLMCLMVLSSSSSTSRRLQVQQETEFLKYASTPLFGSIYILFLRFWRFYFVCCMGNFEIFTCFSDLWWKLMV